MSYHVLVAVDSSGPSREAVDYVLSRHAEDTITALHVLDPADLARYEGVDDGVLVDFGEIQQQRRTEGEELVESIRDRAADRGVDLSTELVIGRPARAIVDYVEDNGVDHVVIGSHGRSGASRILLGSVAESVARRSPVPVTIVR